MRSVLDGGDGVHHVHAGGHLAKGGVLAVQMLGVGVHDEELAAGGVGAGGTGHADRTPRLWLQVVLHAVEEELALDAVAGAAHAGALRAAALDHEAGNDSVEDQAVIIDMVMAQVDEVVHALGRCCPGYSSPSMTPPFSMVILNVGFIELLSFIARSI